MSIVKRTVVNSGVPGWDGKTFEKLTERVRLLGPVMSLEHTTAVLIGLERAFEDVRREGKLESLDEIEGGLMTLWAVSRALRPRCEP